MIPNPRNTLRAIRPLALHREWPSANSLNELDFSESTGFVQAWEPMELAFQAPGRSVPDSTRKLASNLPSGLWTGFQVRTESTPFVSPVRPGQALSRLVKGGYQVETDPEFADLPKRCKFEPTEEEMRAAIAKYISTLAFEPNDDEKDAKAAAKTRSAVRARRRRQRAASKAKRVAS